MWFFGSIIFLMLLLTLVMSFPSAQTAAAKRGAAYVNNRYGTDIQLERLRYVFPDRFILSDVIIRDEEKDTLISAENIDAGLDAFISNTAYSSGVTIDELRFYWLRKKGEEEYSFMKFVDKFSTGAPASENPFGLKIADVEIRNGWFRYEDFNCDSCLRFFVKDIYTEIRGFDLKGNEVSADIRSMEFKDQYSLDVHEFASYMEYMDDHFSFENTELRTSRSYFKGAVRMEYESPRDLNHFVDKVTMVGNIEESDIASEDIQYFAEAFPDFDQFQFEGRVNGRVDDLSGKDIALSFGSNSNFTGDLTIRNSTTPDSLFLNADDVSLHTSIYDIKNIYKLFSDSALPEEINPLGYISLHGDFEGYLEDFKTDVAVQTSLGSLAANLRLDVTGADGRTRYVGKLQVNRFNLARLLNDSALGIISTDLAVDGTGFDPLTMNTKLVGKITSFDFNNYRYQNISVDGRIKNSRFKGHLDIHDPNFDFNFNGTASFGKDTSYYDFTAEIEKADLYALNFARDSIASLTAVMNIDMLALNYDRWAGDVYFTNLTYENSRNFHFFEDISINAEGLAQNRQLEINSNILSAKLKGDYSLEGMLLAAHAHVAKYVKTVESVSPPENENFTFDIDINNTRVLTEIFVPELEIEPGSKLDGSYSSGDNTFILNVNSPGFSYANHRIANIQLDYKGGPKRSNLGFNVSSYTGPADIQIDSIILANYYYHDTLNYDLSWIMRDSIDSYGAIHGYALQRDTNIFETGMYDSKFNIGFEDFLIQEGNLILIDTGGMHIENFVVTNEGRSLTLNGNVSDNPNEILRVNLRGFGVDLANYFIGSRAAQFNGELYGDIILTQLLGKPKFAADLYVDSLEMNSTLLGRLNVASDWSVENDTIHLSSSLTLGELTTFSGKGFYQPDSLGTILFDINFDRFRLAALNPVVEGLAENLRGFLSGEVKVRGNTGAPLVTGEVMLPSTAFTVSFLQTDYNLVGSPVVRLLEDRIVFPNMTLRDTRFGTEGVVLGDIRHQNFRNFILDLNIKANELLVLNTSARSEDPYYGTAFVNGNVYLNGPPDELRISADLSTRRNTKFFIPISGATEVKQSDFVTFVNPNKKDSLSREVVNRLNIDKGISLDFNLNINPNAQVGIIIDEDGNEMQATGSGNIRVRIDAFSDIEIYGTYSVADGYYNFNLPPAVKRKFDILRGGTVTWNGDPFGALIDLTARYSTRADPATLIDASGEQSLVQGGPTLVYVDLLISGELMNPDIDFDISAPRAAGNVQSLISTRMTDDDAKYEQVFALLTLGRFMSEQGVFAGGANTQGLVLKGLAGQAESYLNQFTGDYNVTLDYQSSHAGTNGTDPTAVPMFQEEVEVGLSKDFFDDRVTINGSVGVPVGQNNNRNQIAGDFEVLYDITPDGRFRAKAFNRPVQQYNFGQQQNYQQGIGAYYRMDFNTWGDFFQKIFIPNDDAKLEEEEEEQEDIEPEDLPDPDEGISEGK